jgi:hypothetical protein
MALQHVVPSSHPVVLMILVIAVVLLAMAALTAFFGVQVAGPSYQIVPDPAGALPF